MAQEEIQRLEAEEKLGRLLGSQRAFLSFPQPHQVDPKKNQTIFMKCITGGWGSGKSRIGVTNGLLLSALFPGNEGMIGRFHGADMKDSVIKTFWDVCPPSWIKRVTNRDQPNMIVTLKNGSIIYFRHIHDAGAGATKSRRVGSNLGWAFLDQIEEMQLDHVNTIMGRLRNPKAKVKMLICAANPNGRDWHQKFFFPNWQPIDVENGEFFRTYQSGNIFGVHVDSEENRISNGGFVEDDYFDNIINNQPPEWVARYIHASFEDFTGKVYKGYSLDSVHNIDPIPIPSNWECIVPIDVGGSSNWGVPAMYVDERGNLIVTEGFNAPTTRTADVASWIKTHTPWSENRTTFVIDPENKLAATELSDLGIFARVANKEVHAGTLRVSEYFHPRKGVVPPEWFLNTQTPFAIERVKQFGCPRIFVFKTFLTWRQEHDSCVWDEKKVNQIKKSVEKRFDLVDATRYGVMTRPQPSRLPQLDKYEKLRQIDPLSAREIEAFDRRIQAYKEHRLGGGTREMFFDGEEIGVYSGLPFGKSKWEFD